MAQIPYDVRHVKVPFPLRDPAEDNMRPPKQRKRQRQIKLPDGLDRFRFYDVAELDEFPPVEWLLPGHLAAGEFTVFYGKGGTFKSFAALDWACSLAQQGRPVVYIVAEGASGMRARIHAWMKKNNVDELPALRLMPSNVNLHDPEQVERWLKATELQLGDVQPALVIVDTLARNFVGGNENEARDMGMFVEGVEQIRVRLRTAVLVLHHTTKDGKTERGTEALRNASFAMFKFAAANDRAVNVECDRMKDAPEPPRRRLTPVRVELPELTADGREAVSSLVVEWAYSLGYSPGKAPGGPVENPGEYSPDEKRLLAAVRRANARSNSTTPSALRDGLKWTRTRFTETAKSLVERGEIVRVGGGRSVQYELAEVDE